MPNNKELHGHLPNSVPFKIQDCATYRIYFMVQVAHHPDQNILEEQLTMNMPVKWHEFRDAQHQNRHIRLQLEPCEAFQLNYSATVTRQPCIPVDLRQNLNEVKIPDLPDEVLPYLLASRYCNSDLILEMAKRSFGWMTPGYTRVKPLNSGFITIFLCLWLL